MRKLLIVVLLLNLTACASFNTRPVHPVAKKPPSLQAMQKSYDSCINKQYEDLKDSAGTPDVIANEITTLCATDLDKIGDAFGQTLVSKVKHADPAATGSMYASAYEKKTKKSLVKKLSEHRKA